MYYDILEWYNGYEQERRKFDFDNDVLKSNSRVLFPGRFYILEYRPEHTDKPYNGRPIILSLGISKKDPESFLCIDLCVIPIKMREKFMEIYFRMFETEIKENLDKYWDPELADKQTMIRMMSYENLSKAVPFIPLKAALKRYKIKNTKTIYSVPFSGVYKIFGRLADEPFYVNGTVADAQKKFIESARKAK